MSDPLKEEKSPSAESMDFTGDKMLPVSSLDFQTIETTKYDPPIAVVEQDYDSRPQEDAARRNIAYILLAILAAICVATFWFIFAKFDKVEDLVSVLQIIFSPIIALVAAATGFYYGTKK